MARVESGQRWFGVRVWKTWAVSDEVSHLEESIYLVKAPTEEDARQGALQAATRDESDFLNELGEPVKIRVHEVGFVFDPHQARLTSGSEVFSLLHELDDDGRFGFAFPFDSDELGAP